MDAPALVIRDYNERIMSESGAKCGHTQRQSIAGVRATLRAHMKDETPQKTEILSRLIVHLARQHRIPEGLILSIIKVESGFQSQARSPMGAMGLMQLMPETGEWLARRFGIHWEGAETLNSPEANVYLGVKYLALLKDKYGNDLRMMLSAYNRGPAKVDEEISNGQTIQLGYFNKITQTQWGANVD